MTRSTKGLKLPPALRAVPDVVVDAALAGIGLDWETVPAILGPVARGEWERLGRIFDDQPTRFREGDRAALIAFCLYNAQMLAAAKDIEERGPVVPGRSSKDEERLVKNPSSVAMREASTQMRYWARELGLTPDARSRMRIVEPVAHSQEPNPFTPGETP